METVQCAPRVPETFPKAEYAIDQADVGSIHGNWTVKIAGLTNKFDNEFHSFNLYDNLCTIVFDFRIEQYAQTIQ